MFHEYDRSNERNWYRVHIDWIASFIVRSHTEESAMLKVDYYCQANPKLGLRIEPENCLPLHPEWAKPLDPIESDYYNSLGDQLAPIRLVEDNRRIERAHTGQPVQPKTIHMIGQLCLFES